MPCYDGTQPVSGMIVDTLLRRADAKVDEWRSAVLILKSRNDELARLLCDVCTVMDAHDNKMPKDVLEWWGKHQEFDAQRKKSSWLKPGE